MKREYGRSSRWKKFRREHRMTIQRVSAVLAVVLVGIGLGSTAPSRDILVRAAAPPNARGKVYGFVYSGLDVGAALAPLVLGWFLDHQRPGWVFVAAGVLMVACIPCALLLKRQVRDS